MTGYSSCWSDLSLDFLVLIFSRLELVDFIRAAAACRSWRLKLASKDFRVRPKNQIPWLMLSSPSPSQTQFRYFHSLLPSSDTHRIRLPEIAGQFCIGSSQGFFISLDQVTADLRAVNPISGARISLPPTSTILDGAFAVNQAFWFSKAILSPDPVFSCHPLTAVVTYAHGRLAFARPGDDKWTPLLTLFTVQNILFHKNRLHAVSFLGELAAIDLSNPSAPPSLLCNKLPDEKIDHIKCYLVESPDGQDLYYVTRYMDIFYPYDEDEDNGDDEDEDAIHRTTRFLDEDNDAIHRTTHFLVYKLDVLERQWIEVNTLGDLTLFLGCNEPLALSATDHPSIKGNSIYFTDDYKENYIDWPEIATDMGVFDLGDGSIQPLSLTDNLRCLNWPPPIWFTPTLF